MAQETCRLLAIFFIDSISDWFRFTFFSWLSNRFEHYYFKATFKYLSIAFRWYKSLSLSIKDQYSISVASQPSFLIIFSSNFELVLLLFVDFCFAFPPLLRLFSSDRRVFISAFNIPVLRLNHFRFCCEICESQQ